MNFLYPAFLLGGLAIAVPIVLHFLRRDIAPAVPFTAVRLLRKSPVARSKRRRLRDLLLLAPVLRRCCCSRQHSRVPSSLARRGDRRSASSPSIAPTA